MFAGTDTTSLALTWAFYLLSRYTEIQTRLRNDLLSLLPATPLENLTQDEVQSLYAAISDLPYLDNVVKEVLRLIPPINTSIRVAMRDDHVPISSPIKRKDKYGNVILDDAKSIFVPKGTFIHVPIEGFNLDKEFWGETAWHFKLVKSVFARFIIQYSPNPCSSVPTDGTTSLHPSKMFQDCTTTHWRSLQALEYVYTLKCIVEFCTEYSIRHVSACGCLSSSSRPYCSCSWRTLRSWSRQNTKLGRPMCKSCVMCNFSLVNCYVFYAVCYRDRTSLGGREKVASSRWSSRPTCMRQSLILINLDGVWRSYLSTRRNVYGDKTRMSDDYWTLFTNQHAQIETMRVEREIKLNT